MKKLELPPFSNELPANKLTRALSSITSSGFNNFYLGSRVEFPHEDCRDHGGGEQDRGEDCLSHRH